MESYSIDGLTFLRDETGEPGVVDVSYGDNYFGHFKIRPNANRQEFIAECEDYFDREMVLA